MGTQPDVRMTWISTDTKHKQRRNEEIMTDYQKLLETIKGNITFIAVALFIIAAVYFVAFALEKLIEKKCGIKFNSEKTKVNRLVVIAMFAAIAAVLMIFDFPVGFAPEFYKLDFSELPALLGAFMFGPTAGVAIEGVKVLLKIVLKGTTTAFVGDFANFVIGCSMVVPASVVYFIRRSRKSALVGMAAGTLLMVIAGSFMNGFYLLPKFSELYGMPLEKIVAKGNEINGGINSVFTLVAFAVVPLNLLKAVLVSIITMFLYKYISKLIKGQHTKASSEK